MAFDELSERERDILRSRFGLDGLEPRTLGEIAADYGITPERGGPSMVGPGTTADR